jgi:hypothetical protein
MRSGFIEGWAAERRGAALEAQTNETSNDRLRSISFHRTAAEAS